MFVAINRKLSLWRFSNIPASSPFKRFIEVLVVASIVCAFTFFLSYTIGTCQVRPSRNSTSNAILPISELVTFYCDAGDYNELGKSSTWCIVWRTI